MNDEKSSFDHMWDLLNPPREFHNMRTKCETNLWNTLSIHMRFFNQARKRKKYDFLIKFSLLEEH